MRFRKSVKVLPGLRLNLSKSGISASVGGRGGTVNLSKRGVRSTLSVPGTGLSWSTTSGWSGGGKAKPQDEVGYLQSAASKAIGDVIKEAEKLNAVGVRIDRAINALNSGRGFTAAKALTFEKRGLAEEDKIVEIEEKVREGGLFLRAIEERLRKLQFGWFSGSAQRRRDEVLAAVTSCAAEAETIEEQLSAAHLALSDKLAEVQESSAHAT